MTIKLWRLEVIRNGKVITRDWGRDGKHLYHTMLQYIKMNPDLDYKLYDADGNLYDAWW